MSDSTVIEGTKVKIVYGSPAVRDRKIWDGLVPYNEVWRTGANEATYIQTSEDLLINGQLLPKGSYAIFTIPSDSSWTIIFNEEWNQWGAYHYKPNADIFRVEVTPEKGSFKERMTFKFEGNQLIFAWENLTFSLDIQAK